MGSIAAAPDSALQAAAAHILVVSIPAPGHLIPSTSLAYLLAATGAQVTLITTGYVFQHLQNGGDHKYVQRRSSSSDNSSNSSSDDCSTTSNIRFEALVEFEAEYEITLAKVMKWQQPLSDEELQAALERKFLQLQPTPCCIVTDMLLGRWTKLVADKFGVPRIPLFTMAANDLAFVLRVPELVKRGELPFTAAGATKKDILLPGMAAIQAEDVWDSLADGDHPCHEEMMRIALLVNESSTIILNTFDEFEAETFKALRTDFVAANIKVPKILPILLSGIPRMPKTSNKEDGRSEAEKWLDARAPASVIYISFGSLATLSEKEIHNLALALEAANYPFLWVCRPPGKPQVNCNAPSSATQSSQEYYPPGEIIPYLWK